MKRNCLWDRKNLFLVSLKRTCLKNILCIWYASDDEYAFIMRFCFSLLRVQLYREEIAFCESVVLVLMLRVVW
jgi:hypothetical protein